MGSGFQVLDSTFQSSAVSGFSDSLKLITDSNAQDHGFHKETYTWKLPTYPSPKPTLTLTSDLGQNVGLGEG